ncbi:hypothetical protein [Pseudomonas asplenii]|uniref:hypothetical protein n=1 Tax=Pseudomonas asplenii TaxID=53407 RepID=UPI0006B64D07|nr:hypothetical protein [Pseudomonas fuscovaginae]KPA99194.1 hypothetical protein PF70_00675 [Pseudomonas fuscovaginae]
MYEDRKEHALQAWEKLLEKPESHMNAQEQHEELVRLADEYFDEGFIDGDERAALLGRATRVYANVVEGADDSLIDPAQ